MPETLKIVAIGAGNVAHHLIPALHNMGCDILQVYSKSIYNANNLAHRVSANGTDSINELDETADLYLLMVKDDAISDVCGKIEKLKSTQCLAHTSGATEIDVLKSCAENYGSFYPLESFRKKQSKNLRNTPMLIHGNNDFTKRMLRMSARRISDVVQMCSDEERLKYHVSAVFINNFTNHLACLAQEYLISNDLDPAMLNPITHTTFEKIINVEACDSQTGPAVREDLKLMRKHLNLIKDETIMKNLYRLLSDSIIQQKKKHNENS